MKPNPSRLNDLDALRAFAMFLGIMLHGLIPFTELGRWIWPASDVAQDQRLLILLAGIHGFRMQLFFLLSGFFTALMWHKRGLIYLVRHRIKRILVPFCICIFTIVPICNHIGTWGFKVKIEKRTGQKKRLENSLIPQTVFLSPRFEWPLRRDQLFLSENEPQKVKRARNINFRDDYGWVMKGYFHPSETGTHYFAISANDSGKLYLSSDHQFSNLALIANDPSKHGGPRSFADKRTRELISEGSSDERLENQSKGIWLEKGQPYAILARGLDRSGTENLAVTYNLKGPRFFKNQQDPIPGNMLSPVNYDITQQIRIGMVSRQNGQFFFSIKDSPTKESKKINLDSIKLTTKGKVVNLEIFKAKELVKLRGELNQVNNNTVLTYETINGEKISQKIFKKRRSGKTSIEGIKPLPSSGPIGSISLSHFELKRNIDILSQAKKFLDSYLGYISFDKLHHIWFLNYLCWLVLGFIFLIFAYELIRWGLRKIDLFTFLHRSETGWFPNRFNKFPSIILINGLQFVYLIPITCFFQNLQNEALGADTDIRILPALHILFYYSVFFIYGILFHLVIKRQTDISKKWSFYLIPAFFLGVFSISFKEISENLKLAESETIRIIECLIGSAFSWFMIFGLIGLFGILVTKEIKMIRYLSDSSYWLYIAHQPLIQVFQISIQDISAPVLLKYSILCVFTFAVLLLSYELFIRYTWVGTILNGSKKRLSTLQINETVKI